MKNTLLFIFLMLGLNVFAQNWLPIDSNKIYHFNNDNGELISKSIASSQMNDTTFLSSIIEKCDTCTNQNIYYRNQADFLGFYMLNNFDTSFTFIGKDTFTIKTNANIGDSWSYTATKTAIVIDEIEMNFENQIDSIKIVWLENTDTLIISKEHGIIQIPFFYKNKIYKQIGIKDNYGTQELSFWEVYDFNVGDIFQYKKGRGSSDYSSNLYYKLEVTSKEIGLDYLKYTFKKNEGIIYDTITYTLNSHEDSLLYGIIGDWFEIDNYNTSSYNLAYITPSYRYDINNVLSKYISAPPNLIQNNNSAIPIIIADFNTNNLILNSCGELSVFYKKSLGKTYQTILTCFDIEYFILTGYYKGTDTVGTIYNDDYYVGIKELININNFINFYPNPTNSKLQIDLINNLKTQIELYNILGEKVFEESINQNKAIDVSALTKGLYLLKACNENNNCGSSKLIIK